MKTFVQGMTSVQVPMPAFRASGCVWSPDGSAVLMRDLDRFVAAFVEPDNSVLSPEP